MKKLILLFAIFIFSTAETWTDNEPSTTASGSSFQEDQLSNNTYLKALLENIGSNWNNSDETSYDLTINGVTPTGKFTFHDNGAGVYLYDGTNLNDITNTSDLTCIGDLACRGSISGANNSCYGDSSCALLTTGDENACYGYGTCDSVTTGDENTCVGTNACSLVTLFSSRSGNVCIGHDSGSGSSESNRLYIANTNTTTPLIAGNFSTETLTFNANVIVAGQITTTSIYRTMTEIDDGDSPYSILVSDQTILANTASGVITVILPGLEADTEWVVGKEYRIINVSGGGANDVTISTNDATAYIRSSTGDYTLTPDLSITLSYTSATGGWW